MVVKSILIITDAWKPQINGVVRTYEHLAAALEARGHRVTVIGPADFPWRMRMPDYAEIELAIFPGRRLRKILRAHESASVHIGTEGPLGWAARRLCRQMHIPFTTAYHTQFPAYVAERMGRVMPALKKQTYGWVDKLLQYFHKPAKGIIVTTASLVDELQQRGYRGKLFCMNRGVPTDLFQPGPATLYPDLPRPIALYVGRVAIEKNIGAFLSMPWLGAKVVVGDGPSLEKLRAQYPSVIFAGRQTGADLISYYRSADIFVFPSRTDTFGIVLLEALACGLPVAAYNVIGPRDIVTQPLLGALHDDLAKAAAQALTAPGDAAIRNLYIKEHYSWEAAAARFLEILDETGT